MYINKQNNIDVVYAILYSIQRSLNHHSDNVDFSVSIKNKDLNNYQSIQLDHLLYHNRSEWELRSFSANMDHFDRTQSNARSESLDKPTFVKTKIYLKSYAPEKFDRIQKLDGISKSDLKKGLAETKNRE